MGDYFLGIDGGGTHTRSCVINLEGKVVGYGVGGPSNFFYEQEKTVLSSVTSSVRKALGSAGLTLDEVSYSCAALAGVLDPETSVSAKELLQKVFLEKPFTVVEDIYAALAAAHNGQDGIIVIAGTGSNCLGVKGGSVYHRSGGWGTLLGDEGSGYSIGRKGLRACLRAYDKRERETLLTGAFVQALSARIAPDLVRATRDMEKADIAALAPLVFEAAERGDEVALKILGGEIRRLLEMVRSVATQLALERTPVGTSGGCFQNRLYRHLFEEGLRHALPEAWATHCREKPCYGAALLARTTFNRRGFE